MSKKKNLKNSKNFKPQVPGKKIIEQNDEKKSGNKLKILSLAILIWSAIIYGLYIPAVSQSLQRSQESTDRNRGPCETELLGCTRENLMRFHF